MAHFAVTCPEVPGHENSMASLSLELRQRGHEITWIGMADGRERALARGFHSSVIGEREFPQGYTAEVLARVGRMSGLEATRFTLRQFRLGTAVGLRDAPAAIRASGADALIADESVLSARTVAEIIGIPHFSVCSALPLHPDPLLPPSGVAWRYGESLYHRLRNRAGEALVNWMLRPISRVIDETRREHRLPPHGLRGNASRRATIAQIAREFDMPRREAPDWFHYVGSLQSPARRPPVEFPFDRLDGRPLIYASMGTVQNRLFPVFRRIAEACQGDDVQLVISLGGGGQPSDLGRLPGDPIVARYAPQLELIGRAALVITHAGMNTTTESLAAGKPMLAIPITNDQPGVAARIVRSGCGEALSLRAATAQRMRAEVTRILGNEQYAANARRLAEHDRRSGGVARAADIVERAMDSAASSAPAGA